DRRIGVAGRIGRARLYRQAAAGAGLPEVVPGDDRAHARVLLADVGDARGSEGVTGNADPLGVQHLPERVVRGVQTGQHAAVLLGGVAGAALAARPRPED